MPRAKNKPQTKIFVLDTNVLIHNPQSMFYFKENTVVIPITVIEEVDNFKKGLDEKGRNARQIGRSLDELRKQGSLQKGVKTPHGGIIQVVISNKIEDASNILIKDTNDNLILGTALYMQQQNPKTEVVVISKDVNVRIKADVIGLKAENFETDNVKFEELYTGVKHIDANKKHTEFVQANNYLPNEFGDFYPNQYARVVLKDDPVPLVLRYRQEQDTLFPLEYYQDDMDIFGIKPRNEEQAIALDLLLDPDVKLVSLVGKAGTGKTLLAMAAGLHQVVEQNLYNRLIISRPISPLGKDLGYLPGSKEDKFNPWMQPIYDNMEILLFGHAEHKENGNGNGKVFGKKKPSLEDYLDFGFIELEPLTYIRGRSLPNQYIIIDEAQNLTPHEMKTIITRCGEGTKIVLTGDPYQIDIPYLDSESNGLSMAVEKLKGENIVGHVSLHKGERSELADIAAKFF